MRVSSGNEQRGSRPRALLPARPHGNGPGILEQRAADDARGYVADVREEARQRSALVSELLTFSKAGLGGRNVELQPVPLAALAARLVARETREPGGAGRGFQIGPLRCNLPTVAPLPLG